MNKSSHATALNPRVRNEATEWLIRFSEGEVDSAGHEEFNHWLRTSPEHVRAYLRVAALWREAGNIDGKQGSRDIDALISQAGQEGNVLPLAFTAHGNERAAGHQAPPAEEPPKAQPGHAALRFLSIAATLLLAIGVVWAHQYLTRNVYETRIGEHRTIHLPDGSTLMLNAASKVRVRYSDSERSIDLEEGQALFKVAKNPLRPFVVRSGEASVRAVGTQFDVYRKSTGTTVTVVEGKVAVSSDKVTGDGPGEQADIGAGGAQDVQPHTSTPRGSEPDTPAVSTIRTPKPVLLVAGEQLTIPEIAVARATNGAVLDTSLTPQVRPVKVEEATAWTEGLLIFDGTPLTDVIREFNRQNSKPLVLQDNPELAQIKITGTFPANGAERITGFLQERFSVAAHETDDHIALTRQ